MKSKKRKTKKADPLEKIILLSIHSNARDGQLHLRDSMKLTSPDTEAAKHLIMAERAINACVQEIVEFISALYYNSGQPEKK